MPPEHFPGGEVRFPEDEARHAVRVLRLHADDVVTVVDGAGGEFEVRLVEAGRSGVTGRVLEERRNVGEMGTSLTVGLALVKNASRFETFLEKAVELGVSRIIPLETGRSERQGFKQRRADMILRSALKQSGRCRLPELSGVTPLEDALGEGAPGALRLICHEEIDLDSGLMAVLRSLAGVREAGNRGDVQPEDFQTPGDGSPLEAPRTPRDIRILVGPEGGFTPEEVERARSAGWIPVSLGPRRLRAETAAIAAAGFIMLWCEGD